MAPFPPGTIIFNADAVLTAVDPVAHTEIGNTNSLSCFDFGLAAQVALSKDQLSIYTVGGGDPTVTKFVSDFSACTAYDISGTQAGASNFVTLDDDDNVYLTYTSIFKYDKNLVPIFNKAKPANLNSRPAISHDGNTFYFTTSVGGAQTNEVRQYDLNTLADTLLYTLPSDWFPTTIIKDPISTAIYVEGVQDPIIFPTSQGGRIFKISAAGSLIQTYPLFAGGSGITLRDFAVNPEGTKLFITTISTHEDIYVFSTSSGAQLDVFPTDALADCCAGYGIVVLGTTVTCPSQCTPCEGGLRRIEIHLNGVRIASAQASSANELILPLSYLVEGVRNDKITVHVYQSNPNAISVIPAVQMHRVTYEKHFRH